MRNHSSSIIYFLLSALVLFNIGVFAFLLGALNDSDAGTLKMMRAKEIATVSSNLSKRVYDAGVALSGLSITKNQMFSNRFDKAIGKIPQDVTVLKDLIDEKDARQFAALMKVAELLPDAINSMGDAREQVISGKEVGAAEVRRVMFGPMHAKAEEIQKALQIIVDENKELANARIPEHIEHFETFKMLIIISIVGNSILGIATAITIGKTLKRFA